MSADGLKLVVHLGEAARVGGRPASDAVMSMISDAGVAAATMLRGVEGFGGRHRLHTDRLLTLSEDLPLVIVAAGSAPVVAPVAEAIAALGLPGLVTVEGVEIAEVAAAQPPSERTGSHTAMTIYCGRGEEHGGRGVPSAAADILAGAGVAGAIVLSGVDGVLLGARRRARVFSRNRLVPAMVFAVGDPLRIAVARDRVREILGSHVATFEAVDILRRDGAAIAPPPQPEHRDGAAPDGWRRVTITSGEGDGEADRPFHVGLIRELRAAGAAGATALRGSWGHTGEGARHGERLLSLRRRVPVLVTLIERETEISRLWPIVVAATATTGLVTCERVRAVRGPAVH